jgi:hypothetical protein
LGKNDASAFDKLPPFKSQTLLGLLSRSYSGSLAGHEFLYSNSALNRSDNTQATGAEKYDWNVLASRVSAQRISWVLPLPNVSLKWLRFDDLRRRFPVTNTDRGHVRQ